MMTAITHSTQIQAPAQQAEIDVELFTFVERYATNLVRWDLLLYFGCNPDARFTSVELARHTGRTVKATTKELDDLTYLRVLTRHYASDEATYQLARRGRSRRTVLRLAAFANQKKREGIS